MTRGKRGRPDYSSARLIAVYMTVELERHRLALATGKPCSINKACESISRQDPPLRFHGVRDKAGRVHYAALSAAALRGAYYRALRAGGVPRR